MATSFTDWNYLCHHGIIGQKWGVRRYQNSDGSLTAEGRARYSSVVDIKNLDKQMKKGVRSNALTEAHTIPKGTKIYRVTANKEDGTEGTTYVSYMDVDRQHYRGGWVRSIANSDKAYEHVYELQNDLNVPSRKEVQSVVSEVMKNNKGLVAETCKAWLDVSMPEGSWERIERMWNDVYTEKDAQKAWADFTKETIKNYKNMPVDEAVFFTMQTFGINDNVRKQVISELSSRGYNAMSDEASIGGQNGWSVEGGDPLIVFDRKGMLKEMSNKEISQSAENKSIRQYKKTIGKARRANSKS